MAHYSTTVVTLFTHDKPTPAEEVGVSTILQALTDDEIARMPDNHMPLRHWRAEKVRRNPWMVQSVCGAIWVFGLTVLLLDSKIVRETRHKPLS
jgi:hypothetical protein